MPQCDTCQEYLETWQELAQHILNFRSSHAQGVKWASAFLTKARILNQKRDLPQRMALTNDQREAKESAQRELTGETCLTLCLCPRCNKTRRELLPEEFIKSPTAWKTKNGYYFVFCETCSG